MTSRILVAVVFVLCAVNGFAAAGLAAEAAGDWAQALGVYERVLDREPQDAGLWVRVADIEARLGNLDASASALQRSAEQAIRSAAWSRWCW